MYYSLLSKGSISDACSATMFFKTQKTILVGYYFIKDRQVVKTKNSHLATMDTIKYLPAVSRDVSILDLVKYAEKEVERERYIDATLIVTIYDDKSEGQQETFLIKNILSNNLDFPYL